MKKQSPNSTFPHSTTDSGHPYIKFLLTVITLCLLYLCLRGTLSLRKLHQIRTLSKGSQPAAALPKLPVINVWYGDNQTFGQNGIPQTWVNILGNVSARSGIGSLTYSLNGGPEQQLWMGPNRTRLVDTGDFNAEIAYSSLIPNANTVSFNATARDGFASKHTVTVNYVTGQTWPSSYSIN